MEREIDSSLPSPCAVCRNLDYYLFEPGDEYGAIHDGTNPTKYLTLQFQSLKVSAERGCSTCDIINRGTHLFWGDYPEKSDISSDDDVRPYHLCLERRPGKSLTVFRYRYKPWISEIRMRIEFFTKHDATSAHPAFGSAKTVEPYLTIDSATKTINAWLTACEQAHPLCQMPLSPLPKRVLNIAGELPKLVETDGSIYGKYITLSHCWGQDPHIQPTMTTSSNIKNRKEGIPPEQLCTLFKDFIDLVRRLGYEFVWIDSLCIIQDDHEDWINESGKMADVYSNAIFNIAATSLPDSSHGLFLERRTPDFSDYATRPLYSHTLKFATDTSSTVSIRVSHRSDHRFLCDGVINGRWDQAPLLTRAWALQERLLARRSIHFCLSELIWECRDSYSCECMEMERQDCQSQILALLSGDTRAESAGSARSTLHKQLFSRLYRGTLPLQYVYNLWLDLVMEYSVLDLSRPWDRYHAFAGIADIFNRTVKDKCLAGIWKNDIARGLYWAGAPISSESHSRSAIAPTWSWMSRVCLHQGQLSSDTGYKSTDNCIRDERLIISHSTLGADFSFGPCKDNILDITAAVIPARICSVGDHGRCQYNINLQYPNWTERHVLLDADCPGSSGDDLRDGDECFCLLLGRGSLRLYIGVIELACFVVLRQDRGREGGLFNRIGVAQLECDDYNQFENAEVRRLSVI
ncbi:hypothetical protein BP6252_08703 [Coleophoma cylindrospora]|uniref:Heterokaryon incompatibility domain-containing protein n=1 Tax=Coleophoma cylindrospora TaxID=1849047 RepID=A0A3D8R6L8_9HELO|nr:hypothetical protein BP6252_08703 [Coleophoma cylindrospora]